MKVSTSPRICAKGVKKVVDTSFQGVYKISMTAVLKNFFDQSAAREKNKENNAKC